MIITPLVRNGNNFDMGNTASYWNKNHKIIDIVIGGTAK